jgi:hypothetical protein
MHMTTTAETIVSDANTGGTLLAFQVGCRYPRFAGVPRESLAALFDTHDFPAVATRLRSVTLRTALAHVCGRPAAGVAASKGLHVVAVKRTAVDHLQAWVICRASESGAEDVEHRAGARVFSHPTGIESAGPIDGAPEDPDCRALADDLRDRALLLASTCDVATVSKACTAALESVTAYPFLSRGAYILRANDSGARRLVALYRALRATFYDETRRAGLQAGVAEITGHGGNALAVSDAVINDAEAQVAALADLLERDRRGGGKVRQTTLAKHRAQAQGILDGIRPLRELLGTSADRIERLTRAVVEGYSTATTATDLALPTWALDEVADLRDTGDVPAPVSSPAAAPAADEPTPAADEPSDDDDPFSMT